MANRVVIILSLIVVSIVGLLNPKGAYALTPSQYMLDCSANSRAHGDCEKILCEWQNIERNWPRDTGYHEDCSTFQYQIINNDTMLLSGIVGVGLLLGLSVFLVRKKMKAI